MAGRKSSRTPEREQRICDALAEGQTRRVAYTLGGITDKTFAAWMRQSSEFSESVKKAEAEAEKLNIDVIRQATVGGIETCVKVTEKYGEDGELKERKTETTLLPPQWTAAAWWLERRRNAEYGQRQRIDLKSIPTPQLIALLEADCGDGVGESGSDGEGPNSCRDDDAGTA
jgi:hypothetical protein